MARGWESKSVEAQQDAAADRGSPKSSVIHEDPARRTARTTLTPARTRAQAALKHASAAAPPPTRAAPGAQADLKHASAAAHRSMLEQAIADLDRKIAALG